MILKNIKVCAKVSKGNKDRYIPFQKTWIKIANYYWQKYKPKELFFTGQNGKYSASSIKKILDKALTECNISKQIPIHSLRHSYAYHLLENGIDISIISKLLGHKHIKTTMIYLQITDKCFENSCVLD